MTRHAFFPIRRTLPLLLRIVAVVTLVGCPASVPPLPPAPPGVREIAVRPPANRTAADLVVDQPGMIGRYFGEKRSTVPELLAADLRTLLADLGFRVLPATADRVAALQTEIRRWEPYSADYSQVTVSLVATLVDQPSGRTLWTAERRDWRVPTPDARSGPEASATAAREVARALIDGWQPGSGPPAATRTP